MESELQKIERFCDKQIKGCSVILICGPQKSGKTTYFHHLNGKSLQSYQNAQTQMNEIRVADQQTRNKYTSDDYELEIKVNIKKPEIETDKQIRVVDIPGFIEVDKISDREREFFLFFFLWHRIFVEADQISFLVVLPYEFCLQPEKMVPFQKMFETFIGYKQNSQSEKKALFIEALKGSINLVFTKIQDESDRDSFFQVIQDSAKQKNYYGSLMSSLESAVEDDDRVYLFFNQQPDENAGFDQLQSIVEKQNMAVVENIQEGGFNEIFSIEVFEEPLNELNEMAISEFNNMMNFFQKRLKAIIYLCLYGISEREGLSEQIQELFKSMMPIELEGKNTQFSIKMLTFLQNQIQNKIEQKSSQEEGIFTCLFKSAFDLSKEEKNSQNIIILQVFEQVNSMLWFFYAFPNLDKNFMNNKFSPLLQQYFKEILPQYLHRTVKIQDQALLEELKVLQEKYPSNDEQISEEEDGDDDEIEEEIQYEGRNYLDFETNNIYATSFRQIEKKLKNFKPKKYKQTEKIKDLLDKIGSQKDLEKLASLLEKYYEFEACLLVHIEMNNLEKLNEFLQNNYFYLMLKKSQNLKMILLEKLTRYVLSEKAKAFEESEEEAQRIHNLCEEIINRIFNYLVSEEVYSQEQFQDAEKDLRLYQMKLEEGQISQNQSIFSSISVSRIGKNYNPNKSTTSSFQDSVDIKKTKNKGSKAVGNFKALKYLKLLKFEERKELLERVRVKEGILESKSMSEFRNLLDQFSQAT